MMKNIFLDKKGQLQKILIMIIILFLALLIPLTAQNESSEKQPLPFLEPVNLCEDITCTNSELECPDGFVATCENSCNSENGECSTCEPSCVGHEQATSPSTPVENESSIPEVEIVENITSNETSIPETPEEVINITINETFIPQENATIPEADINQSPETSNEPVETPAETGESDSGEEALGISPQPEFDIKISYPKKITRGEIIEINADITNVGSIDVKNVLISWILPEGFEILNDEGSKSIFSGKTYNSKIKVRTSTDSNLGLNQIKIKVSYDE